MWGFVSNVCSLSLPSLPFPRSEENAVMPYEVRKGYEYYWCVDPLDGTKEFLKRNGGVH